MFSAFGSTAIFRPLLMPPPLAEPVLPPPAVLLDVLAHAASVSAAAAVMTNRKDRDRMRAPSRVVGHPCPEVRGQGADLTSAWPLPSSEAVPAHPGQGSRSQVPEVEGVAAAAGRRGRARSPRSAATRR